MDTKLITVRGFAHDMFKVMILTGPTPAAIYKQIRGIVDASDSVNPQYWHLGIHVCNIMRDMNLLNAINEMSDLLDLSLPFDSHCIMDGIFWLSDEFTELSDELKNAIEKLRQSHGRKFIASVIALVEVGDSSAYKLAQEMNILMKSFETREIYNGFAYGKNVSYIDFVIQKEAVKNWLENVWVPKINVISADGYVYVGTWLPDERIRNSTNDGFNEIPYIPKDMKVAMEGIATTDLRSANLDKMVLMYQNSLTTETYKALQQNHRNNDEWVIATGVLAQASSLQYSSNTTWVAFQRTITRHVSFEMAGINHYGSNVCGSNKAEVHQEELCIRWYQFASLTPHFRVTSQNFVNKFSIFAQNLMLRAIQM